MIEDDKRLHQEVGYVGLRAQATAIGFLQLCIELRRSGVLGDDAIDRIKERISCELSLSAPRSVSHAEYARDVRSRLDRLFAGQEKIGDADALSFGTADES
jgi:hypothetical protein